MKPSVTSSSLISDSSSVVDPIVQKQFVCKYGLFFLHSFGLWFEEDQAPNKYTMLIGYFGALMLVLIFAFHFTLLSEDIKGENVAMFITEFLAGQTTICKALPIILNRKSILKCWQKTFEIVSFPRKSAMEKEIADGWDRFQSKSVKLMIIFYIASNTLYQMIPCLSSGEYPVKGIYPAWTNTSPWIYLVYVVTIVTSLLRITPVVASDLCCLIALCRLFNELQIMQYLICKLGKNNHEDLPRLIMRHADVLDYGRMICDNFSMVFMSQHFNMSMSICLVGAVAIYTSNLYLIIILVVCMVFYASQLVVICYVGEKLIQESLKITSCIENCYDRFLTDVPSLRLISMMLHRAQKPLIFSFGSTYLSLSYYARTINTIYSFFMILKSMIQ